MLPGTVGGGGSLDDWMNDFSRAHSKAKSWERASDATREKVKSAIIGELAKRTGLDEQLVNEVIKQWSYSANDADMRSLSIQQAAAEELGLKLSDWQKERIDKASSTSWQPLTSRENERAIIRAMYDYTQEEFAKAGFKPDDKITLYRGIEYGMKDPGISQGDIVSYKGNAIESWTIGKQVAQQFAVGEGAPQEYGAIIEMAVPISSIVATAHTGFGCIKEGEVIATGNVANSKAIIANKYAPHYSPQRMEELRALEESFIEEHGMTPSEWIDLHQ